MALSPQQASPARTHRSGQARRTSRPKVVPPAAGNLDSHEGAKMGRPERPLDPTAGPVERFASRLRKLRDQAGRPKYSAMAQRVHRSQTTLSEAAGGERLPTWDTAEAFVRACGGDVASWRKLWEQASLAQQANGSPAESPSVAPAEIQGAPRQRRHKILLAA